MTDFAQRLLGRPTLTGRVVGLDMARGLAILGMFTAHMWFSVQGPVSSVMAWSHGRSAPLFALLAGVSMGIMQQRLSRRFAGSPALSRRFYGEKILVRATFLILLATLLSLINTRILLILDNYGVWMVCALFLAGLSVPMQLGVIGLLLVAGIPLWHYLNLLFLPPEIGVVLGLNDYQMPTFLIYVLTGLILWRLGWAGVTIRARRLQKYGAVIGLGTAGVIFGVGTAVDSLRLGRFSQVLFGNDTLSIANPTPAQFWYQTLIYIAPHTDSVAETVANTAWCVGLTSLLLLAGSTFNRFFSPLAALGSMALTIYTLHVIWHAITFRLFGYPGLIPSLIIMIVVFLLVASLWRLRFGKGPLEAFLARLSDPPLRADCAAGKPTKND
ncbi:DUF418 domain-containing protein [Mobiluncus curtisii]|uniref:DUF418 domain-containing protein n=1 Tax=Mobiluncus curtisii ATCC 51333 TaxID=887326 RepID=E6LWI4_9ACTO|nr:DUF418 domain-containing protein [Mobiluncus curtisii]EFU81069.1 hypothetical protein HMPREF0388_0221 [Mobiluncus curtisii ATCC 51333]NMW46415.1 DUF418 domain-containing protein [Mobiluncus curtisii]